MFTNRENELKVLEQEYERKGASFTVIYGRRVGKTALIGEYIKNKPSIYIYMTERNVKDQLKQITRQVVEYTGKNYLENVEFADFEQLFQLLADHIGGRKLILVFDEYQNLAQLDKSFSSMLMKVWDLKLKSLDLHLILCGSVISMMYSETLSYSSPLYGRRTSNIHLKPRTFNEKFAAFSFEDYVKELLTYDPMEYLGFRPRKIGGWWDNSDEIDLVAIGDGTAAFIECKWRNQKVDYTVYNDLVRKADKVNLPTGMKKNYVIFAKSGFKDNLEKADGRFYCY